MRELLAVNRAMRSGDKKERECQWILSIKNHMGMILLSGQKNTIQKAMSVKK